jgi:hypothetical protein
VDQAICVVTNVVARCTTPWVSFGTISSLASQLDQDLVADALDSLVDMGALEYQNDSGTDYYRLT